MAWQSDAALILQSNLFDHEHYRGQARLGSDDVLEAVQHYLGRGEHAGLSPNPLFNPAWYESRWERPHALLDYITHGKERDPHALFDTAFYLKQGVLLTDGETPLAHYMRIGWRERRDPHPLFCTSYYLETNTDVIGLGYDPLVHFISHGWQERRQPCPEFDPAYYLSHYPDVACAGINPLMHYVASGARETRNPSAEFDTAWYSAQLRAVDPGAAINPLTHYRTVGKDAGWLPKQREWNLDADGMLSAGDAAAWVRSATAQAASVLGRPKPVVQEILGGGGPNMQEDGLVLFLQEGDVLHPNALDIVAGVPGLLTTFDAMAVGAAGAVLPVLLPGSNPRLLQATSILPPFCVDAGFYRAWPMPLDRNTDAVLRWFRHLVCEALILGGLRHLAVPIANVPISRHRPSDPALLPEVQRIASAIHTPAPTPTGDVSIVICTKDAGHLLTQLLLSILQPLIPQVREIVLVVNRPINGFARAHHAQVSNMHLVQIINYDKPYNFSDQANIGAAATSGEFVLFLNDDIVPLGRHWLSHMLAPFSREEVAITGPLLLYPDETVQHAGVFLGFNNVAGHTLRGARLPDAGTATCLLSQNCSAVTGAAMLVRRKMWNALAGFDTQFATYLQDIDACLRAHRMGWEIVYTPDAVLMHMETISAKQLLREPAVLERRGREHARFVKRWGQAIYKDPFRSPHWSKQSETLRTIVTLGPTDLRDSLGG